ncbi:NAD-dependent epimerase/dehydratase family protein [Phycisphaerales bacterium AB-hyl4]|uniref:NAD-dependent epimerase/dehydratase family protein n=1 Tax=Natronomicrosphaera hydrolytica TaxID=3242702 RepID=A0ABV4U9R9_9BACT
MNVLVIGGAGYVGAIVRPALETVHGCRYLDLRPVPGAEDRTFVGDVNDPAVVREAVQGQDALVYLAMGTNNGDRRTVQDIDAAFNVNVRGLYRTLAAALEAGVRRICVASSLSVYRHCHRSAIDESCAADAWEPYGLSKRVGEFLCQAAAQQCPDATLVALRLILPRNEADWPQYRFDPAKERNVFALGPRDTRELFRKALELDRPGCHIVQASGDITNERLPNHRVRELLGWSPQNH